MSRPLPRRVTPHVNAIKLEHYEGAGAAGRSFAAPVTIGRSLVFVGADLARAGLAQEQKATGVAYFDRSEVEKLPTVDSRVVLFPGTENEISGTVSAVGFYTHPRVASYVEITIT